MEGQLGTLEGRERELTILTAALDHAASGDGTIALVTGEPGIGKSSLLAVAADTAAERGFQVAWGRAWEVGGAPPYWIWIDALRPLVGNADTDSAATARVSSLVVDAAEQAADSFHLCDAVARFARAFAAHTPLLLVFDDLHAADIASLQVALFVARQIAGARVAIVGSYRDVEARRTAEVGDTLARIGRLGEVLPLSRLGPAEVARLVREQIGTDDPEVATMVMDASEGNPLFVRELLRLIRAKSSASGVPAGVRAVIRERLGLLSPATVALLQAAAIIGRECPITLGAEIAGVTPSALEEAAAEAAEAEIVDMKTAGRLRFSHVLVAETLAGELSSAMRARMHRKAAETLTARHEGDPGAPVAEIAHHWLRAGADAAPAAVDAATLAARVACDRLAFADAATLLERAMGALAVAAPADARRRVELMLSRCEALARAGDRRAAEAICYEAAELARSLDDAELFARVALALGAELIVGHADPEVKRLLDEALRRLPATDSPLRARVMARLAGARQPEPDPMGPIAQAREAMAMARRLGDDDVLLYVLYAGMAAFTDYGDPAERIILNRETAALAEVLGNGPYEVRARSRILFDCVALFDAGGFETELEALDALVQRLGVPRYRWMPLAFGAMRADWRGELARGAELYARAREIAGPDEGPFRFPARELMRHFLTDPEDSPELIELAHRAGKMDPFLMQLLNCMVDGRAGRKEAARAGLEPFLQSEAFAAAVGSHDVHLCHILGTVAWGLRDRSVAEITYEMTTAIEGHTIALTGIGYLLHDLVDRIRMLMAAVLERWDDVDRCGAAALSQCERMGARLLGAHVRANWAEILAERDPARARALAEVGEAMANDIGLPHVAARCRAVIDGAGAPAVSLAREGEYWTVRGLGETCRVRDSRGMQMLSMLVTRPGEELHVLELSGARHTDGGDAGELLDAGARAAYQSRLRDLRAEQADAELCNDPGRAERARAEIDALSAELSRAFGLGGRARRGGSAVERARSNVRRRLVDAMDRVADAAPTLGAHLREAVRTGIYCSYDAPPPAAAAPEPR